MNFSGAPLWRNLRASLSDSQCRLRRLSSTLLVSSHVRTLVSKVKEDVPLPDAPKPKPKAATQLRRTASASLPIRSNPTPTRSDIRPVSILTTADRFLLPQLRSRLPASALSLHGSWWVPKWAGLEGREGEIFVFENGSLVCWGLEEKDAKKFAKDFIVGSFAEVGHLREPETEDVEFVTDPNEYVYLITKDLNRAKHS